MVAVLSYITVCLSVRILSRWNVHSDVLSEEVMELLSLFVGSLKTSFILFCPSDDQIDISPRIL